MNKAVSFQDFFECCKVSAGPDSRVTEHSRSQVPGQRKHDSHTAFWSQALRAPVDLYWIVHASSTVFLDFRKKCSLSYLSFCKTYIWRVCHFLFVATEYHLGLLKAKLAKLRAQLLEPTGKSGPKVLYCAWCTSHAVKRVMKIVPTNSHSIVCVLVVLQGEGFDVMKSGDARVALIGFPSVGKVTHFKLLVAAMVP